MTITLGSLTLQDQLHLRGVEAMTKTTVDVSRTILGRTVLQTAPAPKGHPLELVAEQDGNSFSGLFLLAEIQQMQTWRDGVDQLALVHPRGSFDVIITAIEVEPALDVNNPTAGWWFSGTITLLTV